jgi:hypothetical protein
MRLPGRLEAQIAAAIENSFIDYDDLRKALIAYDIVLEDAAPPTVAFPDVVAKLVRRVQTRDKVGTMLDAAIEANPDNEDLRDAHSAFVANRTAFNGWGRTQTTFESPPSAAGVAPPDTSQPGQVGARGFAASESVRADLKAKAERSAPQSPGPMSQADATELASGLRRQEWEMAWSQVWDTTLADFLSTMRDLLWRRVTSGPTSGIDSPRSVDEAPKRLSMPRPSAAKADSSSQTAIRSFSFNRRAK